MSKQQFGTRAFTGLNTQTASHLLQDTELTQADNVNFDELGAVKAEFDDLAMAGATVTRPKGVASVYLNDAVHTIYKDIVEDSGYVRDLSAGATTTIHSSTWQNANRLRVTKGRGEVILSDGGVPRVWDGTILRKLGALVGTDVEDGLGLAPIIYIQVADTKSLASVSVSGGVITVEITGHGYSTGHRIYIDSATGDGADDINGRVYTITKVDNDNVTLDDVSGSGWGTIDDSSGTAHKNACGLTGLYQYKLAYTMELPDGTVIESSLISVDFSDGSETYTLAPTDVVNVVVGTFKTTDVSGWMSGDYTIGADVLCGARIYRTKVAGSNFWVSYTASHADIYDNSYGFLLDSYDTTADKDLGALWLDSIYDSHDSPPDCALFCTSRGRAYCVDVDNPSHLHWSAIGQYDYWAPNDYWPIPEDITAIVPAGDYIAIFSENGLWIFDHSDAVGSLSEIPIQTGVKSDLSALSLAGSVEFANEMGLGSVFFANDLGLWTAGPGGVHRVSGQVQDDWEAAAGGTWAGAVVGDRMLWTCDDGLGSSDKAFTLKIGQGAIQWGRTAQHSTVYDYEMFAANPVNNVFIAATTEGLYTFGGDSDNEKTMMVISKLITVGKPSQPTTVVLDLSAGASGGLSLLSNFQALPPVTVSIENSDSQRRFISKNIQFSQGEYWRISYSGTGTLYGWWLGSDYL